MRTGMATSLYSTPSSGLATPSWALLMLLSVLVLGDKVEGGDGGDGGDRGIDDNACKGRVCTKIWGAWGKKTALSLILSLCMMSTLICKNNSDIVIRKKVYLLTPY